MLNLLLCLYWGTNHIPKRTLMTKFCIARIYHLIRRNIQLKIMKSCLCGQPLSKFEYDCYQSYTENLVSCSIILRRLSPVCIPQEPVPAAHLFSLFHVTTNTRSICVALLVMRKRAQLNSADSQYIFESAESRRERKSSQKNDLPRLPYQRTTFLAHSVKALFSSSTSPNACGIKNDAGATAYLWPRCNVVKEISPTLEEEEKVRRRERVKLPEETARGAHTHTHTPVSRASRSARGRHKTPAIFHTNGHVGGESGKKNEGCFAAAP